MGQSAEWVIFLLVVFVHFDDNANNKVMQYLYLTQS